MPAEDEAESTTKATVSEGEIEIRDKENQKQDLADLNRDTQNALNKLGEIFDKDSIEERQELAGLFGELAYNQIHFMEGISQNEKIAWHALVGGIMSEIAKGNVLVGTSSAALNKLIANEIKKVAGNDPALSQWLSSTIGIVVSKTLSANEMLGASITTSGMKNNDFAQIEEKSSLEEVLNAMYNDMDKEILEDAPYFDMSELTLKDYYEFKIIVDTAADVMENAKDTPIASMLLKQAASKTNLDEPFGVDSIISNDIMQSPEFQEGIVKEGNSLNIGESKFIYTSINYNNTGTLDQRLAYGIIKVGIQISKNEDGSISYNGEAGDVYDFNLHTSYSNLPVTIINNLATLYQNIGYLKAYKWSAKLSGKI